MTLNLRMRLTLLYGGLFLLAGILLVGLLYLLAKNNFPGSSNGPGSGSDIPGIPEPSSIPNPLDNVPPEQRAERENIIMQALQAQRNRTLDTLVQQSLIALAVMVAVAAALGWLVAGRVLRPLKQVTATAQRVTERSERGLHERIALPGPPGELKALADTFDAMLERLDRSFDSQRRFVANASHEMRTPLAINRTLLEVALTDHDVKPELHHLHRTLLTTNERSGHLLDGLLTLARSENEAIPQRPVDLSDIAAHALEQAAHEASAAGIQLRANPDPAPTAGDPALLERLALNLVQNGIRHNHRGGWVQIDTGYGTRTDHVHLRVTNTGPEIPPYDMDGLFEPFRRLDGDRTDGTRGAGLGLSIVRSVARTHGGDVTATRRPGGGLTVHVILPTPAEPLPSRHG